MAVIHSDISVADASTYVQHTNLIKQQKYSEAAALLSDNPQVEAITAFLFNSWEEELLELESIQTAKVFYDPYYYSDVEPTIEEMGDKVIWLQEYE